MDSVNTASNIAPILKETYGSGEDKKESKKIRFSDLVNLVKPKPRKDKKKVDNTK